MQLNTIQKKISSGKGVLFFAIITAIVIRVLFFTHGNYYKYDFSAAGHLWRTIDPLLNNQLTSMSVNAILVVFITVLISFMNARFMLIREKTTLPAAFLILLLSSHPFFLITSPHLIASIFLIGATFHLFSSYNSANKPIICSNIIIEVILGSLFVTEAIFYCIVFIIGFFLMRNLNFKVILASFTTIILIYIPVATYYFITEDTDAFYKPFMPFSLDNLAKLPLLEFQARNWIVLGVVAFILILFYIHNYINSYKDKIQIRSYINFLKTLIGFALIFYITLNVEAWMNIYVTIIAGSILLAHYYTLTKGKVILIQFILSLLIYLTICYNFFL